MIGCIRVFLALSYGKNSDLLERTKEMIALTLKASRQCAAITESRYCDTFIVQLPRRDNKLTASLMPCCSSHYLPACYISLFAPFFSLLLSPLTLFTMRHNSCRGITRQNNGTFLCYGVLRLSLFTYYIYSFLHVTRWLIVIIDTVTFIVKNFNKRSL